jgi:hypothetical protein
MADPLTAEDLQGLTWYRQGDLRAVGIDDALRASLERRRFLIRATLKGGEVLYALSPRGRRALSPH